MASLVLDTAYRPAAQGSSQSVAAVRYSWSRRQTYIAHYRGPEEYNVRYMVYFKYHLRFSRSAIIGVKIAGGGTSKHEIAPVQS